MNGHSVVFRSNKNGPGLKIAIFSGMPEFLYMMRQDEFSARSRIAVIIPTFNAARHWAALSAGIRAQSVEADQVIVIDSSSSDGTADLARHDSFTVIEISPRDFNHGGTRQMGADLPSEPTSWFTLHRTLCCLERTHSRTLCARLKMRRLGRPTGGSFRGRRRARSRPMHGISIIRRRRAYDRGRHGGRWDSSPSFFRMHSERTGAVP